MAIKMITVVAVLLVAIQGCLGHQCSTGIESPIQPPATCPSGDVPRIPHWHIYSLRSRRRPLVIGHRGNVQVAQENSFDSIKGAADAGADGFEVDVFMTADGELVCFHDQDTLRLTGESHDIEKLTKAQVEQLSYQKTIQYCDLQKTYDKRRSIAFLKDVLRWARDKKLLVYIEMKPAPALDPATRLAQVARSKAIGESVAQLVKREGMLRKAIVNSFDVLKSDSAKKLVTQLVIGISWTSLYWLPGVASLVKYDLVHTLPDLAPCLAPISTDNNEFIDFLIQSGSVEKHIGAVIADLEFSMFNISSFGKATHTMCMLKKNFGRHAVVGAYTMYDASKTPGQIAWEIEKYQNLLRDSVDLLYTDNICAMVQLVDDTLGHPYGRRRRSSNSVSHFRRRHNSRRRHRRSC